MEESGVASGFLKEYYIQTGDEFYLDLLMDSVQGTLACSEEEKDYLQWLYENITIGNRKIKNFMSLGWM